MKPTGRTCKGCGVLFQPRQREYFGRLTCSRMCADIVHGTRLLKIVQRRQRTKPERALFALVGCAYPDAIQEVRFGQYVVDIYVPSLHMAFEADGEYWHRGREERDARRDRDLMERFELTVARFGERELMQMRV